MVIAMVCRVKCTDIDATEHNERTGEKCELCDG